MLAVKRFVRADQVGRLRLLTQPPSPAIRSDSHPRALTSASQNQDKFLTENEVLAFFHPDIEPRMFITLAEEVIAMLDEVRPPTPRLLAVPLPPRTSIQFDLALFISFPALRNVQDKSGDLDASELARRKLDTLMPHRETYAVHLDHLTPLLTHLDDNNDRRLDAKELKR